MITPTVSSAVLSASVRLTVGQVQGGLLKAEREVASGRHADAGLALGGRLGEAAMLRGTIAERATLVDMNAGVTLRLEASQSVIASEIEAARGFVQAVLAARGNPQLRAGLVEQGRAALAGLTAGANTMVGGVALFGGVETAAPPLAEYYAPAPSAARQAVDAAYLAAFGVPQGASATAAIDAGAMRTFLAGPYAALFSAGQWQGSWSAASDTVMESRIAPTEVVQTSASANETPFRAAAQAYTMLADLGAAGLDDAAFGALADAAVAVASSAIDGFTAVAARLGAVEERVATADRRLAAQITLYTGRSDALEAVDPYEAATRLTALQTQLETAYALTARLQGLSLVDFL